MTWSILVRDAATGALGAAVASRFFAVGALCIHVEGRVGALATQALVNPMYAVHGMPRLREGQGPQNTLDRLVLPDPGADQRQLHLIDARGEVAQHTGSGCVDWAGHLRAPGVSVAGNMLAGPAVLQATLDGYLGSARTMAERLLTAMEAGEMVGGDKRGKQSAALKICLADPYPTLDIRADDHPDPLAELRRLHRASLERFAISRSFMAGTDDPWGTYDRAVINAACDAGTRPGQA